VKGLDTVVIDDTRFANLIEQGRNVLTRVHLGANEILQMAGRVHGRVEGGRVFILSDRDIEFQALRPTEPDFQLAGDSERVALTCADLGVRADELDLPVPLDRIAYRAAVAHLEERGIVDGGRLTSYGKAVEALPVERPWAELLVHADDDLVPYIAVAASIESLHRMTRDERELEGLIVPGSDHLTAYNLYADAYRRHGSVGEVYGLPRHVFGEAIDDWAERRGALVKAIEDAALGMASIYRALGLALPSRMTMATDAVYGRFADLLARIMPFDLVIGEQTAEGEEARVSKGSVCGTWGAVAGTLRYFADRTGTPRAAIEGTQISLDLVRRYATLGEAQLVYDPARKRSELSVTRRTRYHGFELGREREPVDTFPEPMAPDARRVLAEALARGEARHPAVRQNRNAIDEIRSVYRRSGGLTPRLGMAELVALYESRLGGVGSMDAFRSADLRIDADAIVPAAERARWMALPSSASVRGYDVPIEYDVDDDGVGVIRLRLPEKLARTLTAAELPELDRPLRFVVTRGQRGAVRASSLDELQELLDRPWSPGEPEQARERDLHHKHRGQAKDRRQARGRRRRR